MKSFLELLARRYIAGAHKADAVQAAKKLNSFGIKATIDHLGENVASEEEAAGAVTEYLSLIDLIEESGADSSVSLKLTHLGLDLSVDTATVNLYKILKRAASSKMRVCIDMESSAYTDRTLGVLRAARKKYDNLRVAIQSCLKRSGGDVEALLMERTSVRLVKGAYKEAVEVAYEDKADVDKSYAALTERLLKDGVVPAIATHDERLIDHARAKAEEYGTAKDGFEFQMLLGIKRRLQKELAEDGYTVRVYVPYGTNSVAYMLRRLRERRENLYFLVRHLFD